MMHWRPVFRLALVLATLIQAVLPVALAGDIVNPPRYRIGMLLYRGETDAEVGFRQYLQQKGIQADYIVLDAAEDPKKLPALVEEMRRQHPDLIYAFGTSATLALAGKVGDSNSKRYITDIPIVFNIVADPIGSGISTDLSGSKRNVTGVMHLVPINAQLSALRASANFKKLAVIYSANEKNSVLSVSALENAAPEFDMQIRRYPVGDNGSTAEISHLKNVLEKITQDKPDAVYVPSDSFLIRHAALVSQQLNQAHIPTVSATEAPIRQHGMVMGLVSPYRNAGAFAGHKAYQILAEKREVGTIPISSLDKFTFLLNMKTALSIGFYPKIGALGFAEVIGLPSKSKTNVHD